MSVTARLSLIDLPSVIIEDPALLPPDDLTVQVHHDGAWHRRAVGTGGARVGCGDKLVRLGGDGLRHETYEGQLCKKGCFSPWELAESHRINTENSTKLVAITYDPDNPERP